MIVRNVLVFTTLLLSLTLNAQQINWLSFEQAIKLNKKEPRNIIIDVYTDWCGWCKIMDEQTFRKPQIAKIINTQYYAVKLNAETTDTIHFQGKAFVNSREGKRPPHQLAIGLLQGKMSYPNIVFINKSNQVIGAIPVFKKPEPMQAILDYISKELYRQKIDLQKYMQEYNKE